MPIEEEWGKRFRFTMTTNGVLLSDENIEYYQREHGQLRAVSGWPARKSMTDHRPTVNGQGQLRS